MPDFATLMVAVVIDAVICAVLSSSLARRKGYDTAAWGVLGFLLGPLGLITAAGLPLESEAVGGATSRPASAPIFGRCAECGADLDARRYATEPHFSNCSKAKSR